MPLTCSKAKEAFDHVHAVFQVPKEGLLYKALEKSGDTDIRDMVSLRDTDIDSLTYDRNETDKDVPLSMSDRSTLHILDCHSIGDLIGHDWWFISADDFDSYQTGPAYQAILAGSAPPHPVSTLQNPQVVHSAAEGYKHDFKHNDYNAIHFKSFSESDWDYSC